MTTKSPANLLVRAAIIFIGMFALLIAYYWVHKPFDAPIALRVGGTLLDLLTVAALFGIAAGIGRAALTRLDLSLLTRPERLALELGIGLGMIALGVLLFGLFGLFRPLLLWGLLIIISALLRKYLISWLLEVRDLLRSIRIESAGQVFAALFCGVLLVMALMIALAPPTHWDSLTYHLVGVQRYIQQAGIYAQPDNFYLGLSQNVEMLFGLTVGLFGRDTAAAPVHFGLGVVALLATAGLVRRFAGRSAGWAAVVLLLSSYSVWGLFGWAYVDLGTMIYGALSLVAATAWREKVATGKSARGWLILMGIIIGLAMGVKYTTLALGLALGVFVLIHQPRRVVQNGIIMALAAMLAFAPWAAKGVLLYHNPIYPFALNGLNWNADRAEAFNSDDYSLVSRSDAWQLPIIPLAATIFGQDLIDGYGFTTGPWLLTIFLLLPLVWALLEERARRLALDAVTIMLVLVVFWAVNAAVGSIGVQTRLMVMVLPAFAAAGAVALHGLANFPKKPFDINFIVRVLLALTLALIALDTVRETVRQQVVPFVVAQDDMSDYMYANTGAYYNALHSLPPDSRVLLMWEPRGYYCPPTTTCTADVLFDNWKLPMLNDDLTPDEVFERYRAEGQDYLLVFDSLYEQYLEFSTYPDLDRAFPETLERWMTPVWTDGVRYTLYGWKEPSM